MSGEYTPQTLPCFSTFSEKANYSFERELKKQGFYNVAGVDEVGRGPLAGPVVAASVILPGNCQHELFQDSKTLSAATRDELFDLLHDIGALVGIGIISEQKIDQINILQASLLAMREAILSLPVSPDFLLVDGKFQVPMPVQQQTLVKGDSRSSSIAAASIVAKVTRDRLMEEYHTKFPEYNFKQHKGYPTKEHRRLIKINGPCAIHRRSFKGVREFFSS